jgi:hypothetical protein
MNPICNKCNTDETHFDKDCGAFYCRRCDDWADLMYTQAGEQRPVSSIDRINRYEEYRDVGDQVKSTLTGICRPSVSTPVDDFPPDLEMNS